MSETNQHRRNLLKAGAGLPAVLTVHPGTAVAASSSQCVVKDKLKTPKDVVEPAADTWLRCSVTQKSLTKGADSYTYVKYPGAGSGGSTGDCSALAADTNWYLIDAQGDFLPGQSTPPSIVVDLDKYATDNGYTVGAPSDKSALVHISTTSGEVTNSSYISKFAWVTGTEGQQITTSCLTSFI